MPARMRLVFESHFMPLPTPESTENKTKQVITEMITMSMNKDEVISPALSSPALICNTPSPSEVATPKIVPTRATTSMRLPRPPRTLFPNRGSSVQRIDTGRPRRWMAYASAKPMTT